MEYPNRLAQEEQTEQTPSREQFNPADFFREHLVRDEESNKYVIKDADKLSPVELALLETEKRRRGTQAAVSREKVRASRYETELQKVKEMIPQMDPSRLAPQVDESLKYSDPDEYIRQKLEAAKHNPYEEVFNTASEQATTDATERAVQEELNLFNADNPDRQLTVEMLNQDIPPRLVQQLEKGEIAPQEFLDRAADFLYRPGKVVSPEAPSVPDLGEVGGQTTPTDDGSDDAVMTNYSKAIF